MKKTQTSLCVVCIFVTFIVATRCFKRTEDSIENIIKSFNLQNDAKPAEKEVTLNDIKDCDCGENSSNCTIEDGVRKCECTEGYGRKIINLNHDQTCTECNCGTYGISCLIGSDTKLCTCQLGNYTSYLVKEKCKECDCGPNNISCEFDDKTGIRLCKCANGYVSEKESELTEDEYCKPCDCGLNGTCTAKNSRKYCSCDFGFTELDRKCVECDCGEKNASYNCTRTDITQYRRCYCNKGYARVKRDKFLENETCERCDCGEFAVDCEFYLGYRSCKCKEGYIRREEFGPNDYCEKYNFFNGWTITVIVIAVVGAVVATGAIIIRKNRSAANR